MADSCLLQQSHSTACACIQFRSQTSAPPSTRRPHRQQRQAPRRLSCASVAQTAESALQVRPASVEVGFGTCWPAPRLHVFGASTRTFVGPQGGTFTVRGSLETACQPDGIYQTLIDYANLPKVFKNLDSCKSWTEAGQKKLLQVVFHADASPCHCLAAMRVSFATAYFEGNLPALASSAVNGGWGKLPAAMHAIFKAAA